MARPPSSAPDPTRDAAALLRRLGFVVLAIGVPLAALVTRRGAVSVLPVGIFLVFVAACLDGAIRPLRVVAGGLLSSSATVAIVAGIGWAALTLAWSAAPGIGAETLATILGVLLLGLLGFLVLPERMRAANLYLVPNGGVVAALAVVATVILFGAPWPEPQTDGHSLERGVSALLLVLWPSLAWLRSRERDLEALTLAILAATAALMAGSTTPLPLALGTGAVAYALVTLATAPATILIAGLMSVGVLLPALLPFANPSWLAPLDSVAPGVGAGLRAWRAAVGADWGRLVTGHGFGALAADRLAGTLPASLPRGTPFWLWYDLGLVGGVAAATSLFAGLRAAIVAYAPLLPGVAATYATAFALACLGPGPGQAWWLACLVWAALALTAAERGQFRTRRPRMRLFVAARERAA